MITEDYVSFETAKLLKEKGLKVDDETCRRWAVNKQLYEEGHFNVSNAAGDYIPIPTIQMAMKWLREVHNIVINIGWGEILEDKFQWWCIILNQKDGSILRESEYYATYEEASEAAIKYCLENLI